MVGVVKKKKTVRPDLKKYRRPFEKNWEIAVEASKEVEGRAKMVVVREAFRVQCEADLRVLDLNERQMACKTPSKPMKEDKRCPVFPPFPEKMVIEVNQKVVFDCTKRAPQVCVERVQKMLKEKFQCLVCGEAENEKGLVSCTSCNVEGRGAHAECLKFIGSNEVNFECKNVTKRVVMTKKKVNGEVVESRRNINKLTPKELPARFRCLICGEFFAHWDPGDSGNVIWEGNIVRCRHYADTDRKCEFGVHPKCLDIHDKVGDFETTDHSLFACIDVKMQISSATVEKMANEDRHGISKSVKRKLVAQNSVQGVNVEKRYRRYITPNNVCEFCNLEIPRAQKSHLMQHCTKFMHITPVPVDPRRDLRAFKRRAYAIAQGRLKPPDRPGARHGVEHGNRQPINTDTGIDQRTLNERTAPELPVNAPMSDEMECDDAAGSTLVDPDTRK